MVPCAFIGWKARPALDPCLSCSFPRGLYPKQRPREEYAWPVHRGAGVHLRHPRLSVINCKLRPAPPRPTAGPRAKRRPRRGAAEPSPPVRGARRCGDRRRQSSRVVRPELLQGPRPDLCLGITRRFSLSNADSSLGPGEGTELRKAWPAVACPGHTPSFPGHPSL
jgi:hypothetical protein